MDVGKNCRLNEVTTIAVASTTGLAVRSLRLTAIDVAHDLVELSLVDLWPLLSFGVKRIPKHSLARAFDKLCDELIMHRFFHKQSTARAAALSLIEEQPELRAGDSGIKICVGEDNVGALAAEFKRQPFQSLCGFSHDDLCRRAFAREGNFVNLRMLHQ